MHSRKKKTLPHFPRLRGGLSVLGMCLVQYISSPTKRKEAARRIGGEKAPGSLKSLPSGFGLNSTDHPYLEV